MIDDDCQMDEVCIALACGPADNAFNETSGAHLRNSTKNIKPSTLIIVLCSDCRFDRDCRPGQRCFNDHCEDRFGWSRYRHVYYLAANDFLNFRWMRSKRLSDGSFLLQRSMR
jgi:hypothetical protein